MERKIIAVMGITLLIGLGIGYGLFYILFEYTGLRTGETKNDSWNTILSFTGSDNEITDSFSIKTDQWRINWHILPEEKWLVNGFVRDEKEQETDRQVYVVSFPFKWNGLFVFDDEGTIISTIEISLEAIARSGNYGEISSGGSGGEITRITFLENPNINGISYISQGNGEYRVKVIGIQNIEFTIEYN